MLAVPGLIDLAYDPALDAGHAVVDLPSAPRNHDTHLETIRAPPPWRNWFISGGAKRKEEFRKSEQWNVLGNN